MSMEKDMIVDAQKRNGYAKVTNPDGNGYVVLLCEHASHHIPSELDDLGLKPEDRKSHAVWDPGAIALSQSLSVALDAPLISSQVSRLVYDCNRPPEAAGAMPEKSELIVVPGNIGLTQEDRKKRVDMVYRPFCKAVESLLDARKLKRLPTAIVTVHSFTPVYFGVKRDVEIGILHDVDTRLADSMLSNIDLLPQRTVLRNEPYGPVDGVTHSLQIHAVANHLPNVMLEIRNDLMQTQEQVDAIKDAILVLLNPAIDAVVYRPLTNNPNPIDPS